MRDLLELYEQREALGRDPEQHAQVQPILEELAERLGFDQAFIARVDALTHTISGIACVGIPEDSFASFHIQPHESPGVLSMSLEQGKHLLVQDALKDERVSEEARPFYVHWDMHCFAAVPLLPVSCVLAVGKPPPLHEHEIYEVLPYASQLIAALSGRDDERALRQEGELHAIEKEWLWWMLNAVQDPLILTDNMNTALYMNVHAERLLQITPDDSPGKRRAIELNNFLLSATMSSFALTGGGPGRELSLVDPIEGNELLFEVICHPATNLRTGEQGIVAVLKDVTDLRRAAEQLSSMLDDLRSTGAEIQQERDRLNSILANVADPIVVTDSAGEIMLMNDPADRLLPTQDERHVGGAQTHYLANEAKLSSFLVQLKLTTERTHTGELILVDPETNEALTVSITATAVRDDLGELTAVVCVMHDLTRIRELEQRRVEQQLFESEKLAAVGRLAATLAHEINNPLEAIKNSLYLIESRGADEKNARFLEIARKETERVSGIIRQVLGFYRPTIVKAPAHVNQLLNEALELLERQLRQHRVTVRTDLARDLPEVTAPADLLKQVVLNLLINAQEAMPKGGEIAISTRLSRETDTEFLAGRYVLIQVSDNGEGIDEDTLPNIFDPFFSTKESKGTGLGLWVSQSIAQNHGGQIKVQSRPGEGTTFTVALQPVEAV
jgi:PAS domain S-box-containing protein